jgi:SAM-dependent methyltransferase
MPVGTPSTKPSVPRPAGAPNDDLSRPADGSGGRGGVSEHDPWPEEERRSPPLSRPDYLHLRELVRSIRKFIRAELIGLQNLRILDVGCGEKPYFPLFRPFCSDYVGIDLNRQSTRADCAAAAEALPFADDTFDVVVSTQALGYVGHLQHALRDVYRVLKPGGKILVSLHGLYPFVGDYWRVTKPGAIVLLQHAGFHGVRALTNGHVLLCLIQLAILFLYAASDRGQRVPRWLMTPFYRIANIIGLGLYRIDARLGDRFGSMNYTAFGRKPAPMPAADTPA